MKSVLTEISNRYSSFSYSERLFADYVLTNRDTIVHMPIAELSSKLGIAPSTIVAATHKMGFEGYRDFKISLASELMNPLDAWENQGSGESALKSTYSMVVQSNIDILKQSLDIVQNSLVNEAASLLLKAEKIYLFGVGASGVLAREAYDFFFRLGLDVHFHEDLHYQLLSTARIEKNDLALIISQTGVNRDIIQIARLIRERHRRSIGISNYTGTPFSKYMDILLAPLTMLSKVHDNHFSFRIPILCMIETLYYEISEQMGERYQDILKENQLLVENSSVNRSQSG